jgi:hypothetical protein
MNKTLLNAIIFIAISAIYTGASAQQVYKCGKSYSQIPCPGAVAIDTRDARSKSQKRQSQKVIARDTELAKDMEETRQKEDAMALAARAPTEDAAAHKVTKSKSAKSKSASSKKSSGATLDTQGKKKKEDPYFTAKSEPQKK